jgi:hypothetical protein
LKVLVHGNDDFVARVEDARKQGTMLPVIPHQVDTSYLRIRKMYPLNGIPSGVRAAIVDEENFERSIFPLKNFRNVSCQRLESQRLAIRRTTTETLLPTRFVIAVWRTAHIVLPKEFSETLPLPSDV